MSGFEHAESLAACRTVCAATGNSCECAARERIDVRGPPHSVATVRLLVGAQPILHSMALHYQMNPTPAGTRFPVPLAAASVCEGRDVGGPGRDHEDHGVSHDPLSEPGRRFSLAMLPGLRAPDCARQPSCRKRAGQAPPGRAAVRGRGTDRVGPPAGTLAQPAAARRKDEYVQGFRNLQIR